MAQMNSIYYYATGRRKASTARVFLKPGTGQFQVNGRLLEDYFGKASFWHASALKPFEALRQTALFDAKIFVKGGGLTGQSGAVSLGIARALVFYAEKNAVEAIVLDDKEDDSSEGSQEDKIEETTLLGIERWHRVLRKSGFLTRDSRRVLRKKVGLVKARKAKQFSKR